MEADPLLSCKPAILTACRAVLMHACSAMCNRKGVCTAICDTDKLQGDLIGRCAVPALHSGLASSPRPHLLRYRHSDGMA